MSRQEQAALVAWINSFRPSRRITSFETLADGRAFMEVLSSVDATHFKNPLARGPGAGPSSPDNWVLKTNTLKRIYRLILSYPLAPPHHPLSTSNLPEPPFSVIVKSPTTAEGSAGLVQLARMVLCLAVWAPGNEKIIGKIQGLGEAHMAELMRGIEEIMGSMPDEEGVGDGEEEGEKGMMERLSRTGSPIKKADTRPPSPPGALREERDRLVIDNDAMRIRCEAMADQVAEMETSLEEAKAERDDALSRLTANRESSQAVLRSSQGSSGDVDRLRTDLLKAEETVAKLEDDLSQKTAALVEMEKTVASLQEEAAEAAKMKDQLDEYRHLQDKLHRNENVLEKYKKKLEESAAIRRELKNLEEENAQLLSINTGLEGELRKSTQSKALAEGYQQQIAILEQKASDQAAELLALGAQLEAAQNQLLNTELANERDKEELQLYQEKVREVELGAIGAARKSREVLTGNEEVKGSLNDELDGHTSPAETKTDLKLKIRRLERELDTATKAVSISTSTLALEKLLDDTQRSKDKYQSDYLSSQRETLRLEAKLDAIKRGQAGTGDMAALLKMELAEAEDKLKGLETELGRTGSVVGFMEKQLKEAKEDLFLMGQDERNMMDSVKRTARADIAIQEEQIFALKDQIEDLKQKDRLRMEEIKTLLNDKVDLQSSGIDQREKALLREMEFGDLKAQLAKGGLSPEAQDQLIASLSRNEALQRELEELRSEVAMRNQTTAEPEPDYAAFEEAQKAYELQIFTLRSELDTLRIQSQAETKRHETEQDLMLSAWHNLGSKVVRDHLASIAQGTKRSQPRAQPRSWLGRQKRWQEDAIYSR